ncbi:MAG TPA: mechanosensitive ion channel domain-containing protein [Pyrinomonadaceae bacterium]|jgi:small-conductance mechanosensitive channel|nr:mechanosensitive ion channel domain-containing protein [Pyrinomonadaceae bacterium]
MMTINITSPTQSFAAVLVLLEPWKDYLKRIYGYLTEIHSIGNGNIKISVTTLAAGIVIFLITILLSRTLTALLQKRIARHAYLDPGIQYTLARLMQYLIMSIGILLALSVGIGLNLTSLAVIFTALSVGIGFGLQYIAADIASGFILLFERPVRVGDRVSIDKQEGDVQSINLRTTVLMTNDRVSVIVPNSKLVRGELINWSYGDPRARISIPIGVASDADVDLVTTTLLRAAEDIENVLKDPPPKVQFLEFADWSNNFRLLVWTNRPRLHRQIRSDINYKIQKLFTEAGIEIPYPQTEVRLRKGAIHIDAADDLQALHDQEDE